MSKDQSASDSELELRDASGPIRIQTGDPEDLEDNDKRELRFLQRLLAARDYERNERPKILGQIAAARQLLAKAQDQEAQLRKLQLEAIVRDPSASDDNRDRPQSSEAIPLIKTTK